MAGMAERERGETAEAVPCRSSGNLVWWGPAQSLIGEPR